MPSKKALERRKITKKLYRRLGVPRTLALDHVLGPDRFLIVGKAFLKYATEKIEIKEKRAQAKIKKIYEREGLKESDKARLRLQASPVTIREGAGLQKVGGGWYRVFMAGKVTRSIQGERRAIALRNRFERERDLTALQKQFDFTRKEALSFSKEVREKERKLYKKLKAKADKIKDPKRRAKVKRALRLGRLKSSAVNWQINFLLKVLTSP